MRSEEIWVSFCIPTNGVLEWVKPVIDSILEQDVLKENYEIVITDNGNNPEFALEMEKYVEKYPNIVYRKTTAEGFLNQIECFKLASGKLIKFVNHRMHLLPNAVEQFVNFSKNEYENHPQVYFSNGMLKADKILEVDSYDLFIRNISIYSSWSAGLAFWKDDLDYLLTSNAVFDDLFPHITFLFPIKGAKKYIINDLQMLGERDTDDTKKGKYNLFFAFAVRYPSILLSLVSSKTISVDTFLSIKSKLRDFLTEQYYKYILKNIPCSYQLDDYRKYLNTFFKDTKISICAHLLCIKLAIGRIFGR